ncbi:hypothetical protein C8F04DRAFT_1265764 [Mycena alexandri]|uniref:Uncharacterized protein n=1 Tax=Mycena alexandri TaxID=1745969 RepID=A0AAD6WVA2_9AGAR|nr:hypothetical protein C8F04DRAFT_1265764 [Mycena alexandri]
MDDQLSRLIVVAGREAVRTIRGIDDQHRHIFALLSLATTTTKPPQRAQLRWSPARAPPSFAPSFSTAPLFNAAFSQCFLGARTTSQYSVVGPPAAPFLAPGSAVPLPLRPARPAVAVGHGLWRINGRVRRMLVCLRTPRILSLSVRAYLAHIVRTTMAISASTRCLPATLPDDIAAYHANRPAPRRTRGHLMRSKTPLLPVRAPAPVRLR